MDKFLIIDGNSIANRAFYALPYLSNHKGEPSGAVYGFANILIKIILEERPSHVVIAFDHARKTFRNEIYKEYKMQRKPSPVELHSQFPVIKDMLTAMGIKYIEQAGIEADDIIGTVSKLTNHRKIILTGDRDILQLIDDNTTVWLTKKGVSEVDKVDEKRLYELFGIKPYQIIELKGLMGDASDNIPGVKGVGEKTAISLLSKYNNVENIYNNIEQIVGKLKEKLMIDKDMAFISKTLATIKTDCDIDFKLDDCELKFPFSNDVYKFFNEWDFSSLLKNGAIYQNEINNIEVEKVERKILTKDILESFSFANMKDLSYDLLNMEFFIDNKIYYLEKNYGMFDCGISLEDVLNKLKEVFENPNIIKITNDSKQDLHILNQYGISLNNYFDLSIAQYIVMAGLKISKPNMKIQRYKQYKDELLDEINRNDLSFIFNNIEMPLVHILNSMEESGFKINYERLLLLKNEFEKKIETLAKQIYIEADEEFNINSPKQVANILFNKLGIETYNNKKQSTSADILEQYRYIQIIDDILMYRKYSKLKNTYIDVYLSLCKENGGIIHTTFNQTLTSTGRLSSSEPNLQNIPTRDDEGKNLRKIFISKFDNGKIISADYSQIELRLLADMSGEEGLIQSYLKGQDIHRLTASQIFNIPINEVSGNERRDAKAVNFGIIYGISDYGLSQNIKSTRKKAKDYIDSYFEKYPVVKQFMDNNVVFAKEHGYSVTKFGRRRKIPEISSSKYVTRNFGERVAMNMPLQGTASDIIKLAMIKVFNRLKKEKLQSQLILQIHDELIIDTYPGEEDEVVKILHEEMEHVADTKVPLLVSVGIGESLFECK